MTDDLTKFLGVIEDHLRDHQQFDLANRARVFMKRRLIQIATVTKQDQEDQVLTAIDSHGDLWEREWAPESDGHGWDFQWSRIDGPFD